jgi:alkylation response protein AidB-like acyl-CoA dehydrogenase
MQILGLHGQLEREPWAPFDGYMEWEYRFSLMMAIGGGSNEIQRIIIAIAGLGLPRP